MTDLIGGYQIPYDPRPAIAKLDANREEAIDELWENLYHQGDVGSASYYAVPALVQAGELSLVAAIALARVNGSNPELPGDIEPDYHQALKRALDFVPQEEEHLQGYYVIHALLHGHLKLANALNLLSVEELNNEYAAHNN